MYIYTYIYIYTHTHTHTLVRHSPAHSCPKLVSDLPAPSHSIVKAHQRQNNLPQAAFWFAAARFAREILPAFLSLLAPSSVAVETSQRALGAAVQYARPQRSPALLPADSTPATAAASTPRHCARAPAFLPYFPHTPSPPPHSRQSPAHLARRRGGNWGGLGFRV